MLKVNFRASSYRYPPRIHGLDIHLWRVGRQTDGGELTEVCSGTIEEYMHVLPFSTRQRCAVAPFLVFVVRSKHMISGLRPHTDSKAGRLLQE